jgi:hypothetical protein
MPLEQRIHALTYDELEALRRLQEGSPAPGPDDLAWSYLLSVGLVRVDTDVRRPRCGSRQAAAAIRRTSQLPCVGVRSGEGRRIVATRRSGHIADSDEETWNTVASGGAASAAGSRLMTFPTSGSASWRSRAAAS